MSAEVIAARRFIARLTVINAILYVLATAALIYPEI